MPARWVRALCLAFGFTALPFGAADLKDVKAHGPLRYQGVRYELVLTDNGDYPGLRSYFPELSLRHMTHVPPVGWGRPESGA